MPRRERPRGTRPWQAWQAWRSRATIPTRRRAHLVARHGDQLVPHDAAQQRLLAQQTAAQRAAAARRLDVGRGGGREEEGRGLGREHLWGVSTYGA